MWAYVMVGLLAMVQPASPHRAAVCARAPLALGSVIQTGTLQGSATIIAIDALLNRAGAAVAWIYLGDDGAHYVQPSEAISPRDAARLKVRKPAPHESPKLYARQPVPDIPGTVRRSCAVEVSG